jgi:enamine deaminase RidA (YjgF/YER057c/UK114 family)
MQRREILKIPALAAVGKVGNTNSKSGEDEMMIKQGVNNADKSGGPHAIKLTNVSEWMVFAGHAALGKHGEILFPGDAVSQLRWIYGSLKKTLEQEGYSLSNVVQLKMTCTHEVTVSERVQFLRVVRDVFKDIEIPPMGATMSVVHGLAYPGMLCEVDILAAR